MSKKIVHYNLDEFHTIRKGSCAIVLPFDHPNCSNKNAVHTSTVIGVDGDNFETENTEYVGLTEDAYNKMGEVND